MTYLLTESDLKAVREALRHAKNVIEGEWPEEQWSDNGIPKTNDALAILDKLQRVEVVQHRYKPFNAFNRDAAGKHIQHDSWVYCKDKGHMDAHSSMCGAELFPLYAVKD